jgi:hypothetical protein
VVVVCPLVATTFLYMTSRYAIASQMTVPFLQCSIRVTLKLDFSYSSALSHVQSGSPSSRLQASLAAIKN